MANLTYSSEILDDMLFRAGEPTDGTSDFESVALIYLNRAYRSLWMGGNEFLNNLNEDWHWLRSSASLILQPRITTGTVSVTNNSTSIEFSSGPAASMTGYYFKVDDHADVFKISAHTAAATTATLDSVYTGDTDTAATFRLMKTDYSLASDCIKIISPMRSYQDNEYKIEYMDVREMEMQYPKHLITSGVPTYFGMVNETTVRFNKYGSADGDLIRVDYDYQYQPADLTDNASEEPAVPLQYRHVLSDMGTWFLLCDKDDSKSDKMFLQAQSGIKAMANENRSRMNKAGDIGRISPRPTNLGRARGPLRTESGIIIG